MRLLLRRNQRTGLLGKVAFCLEVRAELSQQEYDSIQRYRLGDTMLYQSHDIQGGSGLLGMASRFAWKAMTIHVSVKDLTDGKRIEVKDIVEMLAIEDQIKEAARTFAQVLRAAACFGGEEVVEV